MRITTLTFFTLLSLTAATPIPEDGAGAAALIPGVNITNPGIAGTEKAVKNSYIVVFKEGASDAAVEKHEKDVGKKLGKGPKDKFKVNGFKGYHLETDKAGLEKVGKDPLVAFVEIDAIASVTPIVVNTTELGGGVDGAGAASLVQRREATWGLGRISHRLRGYYNYIYDTTGCRGTRIYIIDTGIRASHTEFTGRATFGKNFIVGSPNTDEHGHGTHCAATAAGNKVGVCRYAQVIGIKVLDYTGHGSWSGIISGMQWAMNDAISRGYAKKSVISMSLEGGKSDAVNAAVQAVINKGIPVVVAAGNGNKNAINVSPASAPNAITVGATDFYDRRAWFSNFGTVLDLFAPGVEVWSAWKNSNDNYAYLDGTSQATPHVAGIAAYLIAKEGIWGPTNIRNRIVSLSTKNKVVDPQGSFNRLAYNGNGY